MTAPYYEDDRCRLYLGDVRAVLPTLESGSVHCVVSSPPYWGLRDYGTAEWEGGDEGCDHEKIPARNGRGGSGAPGKQTPNAYPSELFADICGKCGARRIDAQIGLEKTPEEYVETMVQVFREVRRVLRDDGTLWLNLGDSYTGGKQGRADVGREICGVQTRTVAPGEMKQRAIPSGMKCKDLVGIPWRVAFALQADGWYLRQDIIWHKPNPMPESVRDRCTKAHEYIFLLTKSPRYYYDAEAIREPLGTLPNAQSRGPKDTPERGPREGGNGGLHDTAMRMRNGDKCARNKRSVWTVPTRPYKGAHFAVFPPELVQPCIAAGCPEGGTVLDPFGGSGTVAAVARKNGCNSVLIELNAEYAELTLKRLAQRTLF